jgi:glycosyltransferase involved in cell wall biosynthesis
MNILLCNYEYPPLGGGGGVVMAALAKQLARRHAVTVLTSRALGLPAESIEDGVRVLRVPVFARRQLAVANVASMLAYLPMGALRGWSLGRAAKFDLINTHFAVPTGPLGDFLARRFKIPNVLSVHGGDLYDPSKATSPHRHRWLRVAIRRLLTRADAVVGQSRDTLARVAEIYGVKRPTELIPLGIERPPDVIDGRREEFGLPKDAFVLVTVGRLVARKASLQLLDVVHRCERADVHLLIVGDGPEADAIRAGALRLGLTERVHLLGQVNDRRKFEALSVADVFASTSQHEGFGLVFLEAMAFGLPVVCYDRGGQVDFLRTGETGHVIPLNDVGAFTGAVIELHDQVEQRRRLGVANRQRVETYLIDRCAERYERVFEATVDAYAGRLLHREAL